ncbi:MAG: hypothetical protein MUC50_16055 [Myxococcota bacterium]|jgi:hypothetical protein|nr:hypothetical protein [Myxococcota bacterium]
MSPAYRTLIFCDNCASLAVAELDRAPLCMVCLLEELRKGGPCRESVNRRISPLKVRLEQRHHGNALPPAEVA